MIEYGQKLRWLREAEGLTQDQLADELEISSGYLSLIECGSRTPGPQLEQRIHDKLATRLNTPRFRCEDCGAHMLKARGGYVCARCFKPVPETAERMRIPKRVRTSLPLPCVGRGETQRGDCVVGAENRHSVKDGRPTPAGIARRTSGGEPAEARRQASPKSSSARPR